MEGANVYQIANNCRTSVEMIEKYYAAHIKTSLDPVAINVMRVQEKQEREEREESDSERAGFTQPFDEETNV